MVGEVNNFLALHYPIQIRVYRASTLAYKHMSGCVWEMVLGGIVYELRHKERQGLKRRVSI